jgi:outer membrane immunogenic protein
MVICADCRGMVMKQVVATGLALIALSAAARSADMPFSALPMVAPAYGWTGCYVGGSMGVAWKQGDNTSVSVVDGGSGAGAAAGAGAIPTSFNSGGTSLIGGGQLGCNYQMSKWVFGVETDLSGTKLNIGEAISTNVPPFFPLTSSASQDLGWIGTTRARLGMAWGNILVYATGGAAYANVSYAYSLNNTTGGGVATIGAADTATPFGWTAGSGIEVGLGAWSLRGEYLYYDLGSHTLNAVCVTCTGLSPTVFSAHYHDSGSIGRIGLNYRFY